jgi:hypothetical protein
MAAPATASAEKQCGKGDTEVKTSIDFGCKGESCSGNNCNAIIDMTFAVIRFLSNGVGLFVVGSLVVAGIQYTISRADPSGVQAAQNRIQSSLIALLIFIFSYAILNYVIPSGFFKL